MASKADRERIAILRRFGLHASADKLAHPNRPTQPEPLYHLVVYNTENGVRSQVTRRPVKWATAERLMRGYKPYPGRRFEIERA